ncbi:MAG: SUMF1/EgtB/PvdO family nonheme iron enzyme [Bacteroidaceae bacterium]|nr:SUMF1/EgtB/PvdO family nonheme iron enzyme [Bacteroidaceae bacterium]
MALVDGEYSRLVDRGTYNYEVSAQGYARQSGSVEVGDNTPTKVIKLESILSTLQVSCATQGAQIYIDGKQRGTAPQTLTLSTEPHRIEAKLDGYRTYKEDITLGERENRRLDIPALERLTGSLRVNYKPLGSDVYVDGVKVGSNPGTFRNIGVGSHKVEIRKDGYVTASVNATVNENQAAELSGTLAQSAVPVQNNNNNAVVSQPSSSWGDLQTFEVKGVKFKMVRVQGGTFQMGATPEQGGDAKDDEKPAHSVTLDTYLIGETEVTQELWEAVMSTNPSSFKGAKNPVEQVSWDDCKVFINKLNDLTGQHFRLPTEAEWEFAARGGNKSGKTKYSGSNTIDDVAWYWQNSGDKYLSGTDSDWSLDKVNAINCKTHPVRTKKANELGIYDMSGNVWEWCEDRYGKEYYGSSPQNNPKGAATGSDRVLRGGSWYSRARSCRVSNRNYSVPFDRSYYLGFRLAL